MHSFSLGAPSFSLFATPFFSYSCHRSAFSPSFPLDLPYPKRGISQKFFFAFQLFLLGVMFPSSRSKPLPIAFKRICLPPRVTLFLPSRPPLRPFRPYFFGGASTFLSFGQFSFLLVIQSWFFFPRGHRRRVERFSCRSGMSTEYQFFFT